MNQSINFLREYIRNNRSIPDTDKLLLSSALNEIEKQEHTQNFKIERLDNVKETLTIMLEESVDELEKKSAALEQANQALSQTLQELKHYAEEVEKQKKQVEVEKTRSDKLLNDILPVEIVNELKTYGRSYARKYDEVSVLFADIKDFSSIAEKLQPDELVSHLDDYFRGFDHIIENYRMEKIKTIGDAYMCVSGLFEKGNNALAAVKAALDIQQFVSSFGASKKIQGLPVFNFRIGIHTGPIVAGVIGIKRVAYDIWGDTVNMAARMEQHGESGKINISSATYSLISDHFHCIPRPSASLKNGREVEMYFVNGVKAI